MLRKSVVLHLPLIPLSQVKRVCYRSKNTDVFHKAAPELRKTPDSCKKLKLLEFALGA